MASCRRATSACYYALFHCLARECANLLIGGDGADRSDEAWLQVYRSLEHGHAKGRCTNKSMVRKFLKEIEDFANSFVTMQKKRHDADYDPFATFAKSEVVADIALVEEAIRKFKGLAIKHRRAFCAYVLLRQRD